MSRWHEQCMGHCDNCMSSINICLFQKKYLPEESFRRSMTLGSVRYGMRVGAVSPPPPGAGGVRYRSQSCWPTNPCGDGVCDKLSLSQIPLLTVTPINSSDIISCANRTRTNTENTNELLLAQNQRASASPSPSKSPSSSPTLLPTPSNVVPALEPVCVAPSQDQPVSVRREDFIHEQSPSSVSVTVTTPNQCSLLKTHLKRYALVRPQVYSKLAEYAATNNTSADKCNQHDNIIPDHLHRFHFGVNRGASVAAERRFIAEQRYRDFADRLKKNTLTSPVPPPRTRNSTKITPPSSVPVSISSPYSCCQSNHLTISQDLSHKTCRNTSNASSQTSPLPENLSNETISENNVIIRGKNNNTTDQSYDKNNLLGTKLNISETTHEESTAERVNKNTKIPESQTNYSEKVSNASTKIPTRHSGNVIDRKREKFKRRKGIYFSQWTNNPEQTTSDIFPQLLQDENLSEKDTAKLIENSLLEISKILPESPSQSDQDTKSINIKNLSSYPEWPTIQHLSELKLTSSDFLKLISNELSSIRSESFSDCEPDTNVNKPSQHQRSKSDISDRKNSQFNANIGDKYSTIPTIRVDKDNVQMVANSEMKQPYSVSREEIGKNNSNCRPEDSANPTLSMNSLSLKIKRDIFKGSSSNSLTELTTKENEQGNNSTEFPKPLHKQAFNNDNSIKPYNENNKNTLVIRHQHSSSSPSKLGVFEPPKEKMASFEQLLRNSSEQLSTMDISQKLQNDTRTHVVVELFDNERSYVESLEILVTKYLEPLKAPENANLLEPSLVEEIFYQIPSLLNHHSVFLEELRKRLENWDIKQTIGDLFLEMLSKSVVIDSYTDYVNNWKKAREKLKCAEQSKPAFSRFVEVTARQHLGKLSLDSLLIKPIQKFPQYELLLQRLLKHTDENHPDHCLLLAAQKKVHDQLLKINCSEKETLELEQLREIEGLIDGLIELVTSERQYLRHDLVSMSHGGCPRRERALFLFSDLLLITGIKRRSGTIKKPQSISPASSVASTLEANKYKLLMKIPLEDIEIRSKDENCRQAVTEVNNISEDISVLNQINELASSLHCSHSNLEEVVKEMLSTLNKQLCEQQNNESQLACLDLTISTTTGLENVSIAFSSSEKRTSWEESLIEAKQKLAISSYRRHFPELIATVPIRKTRAGLLFTCAVPNIGEKGKDVWVCNSDGYVGQVCILSLSPEATVKSCNGVCNARILCISSVPGFNSRNQSLNIGTTDSGKHKTSHFDSSSSSDEDDTFQCDEDEEFQRCCDFEEGTDNEDTDIQQSTMWLGTEDGCIYVYNSEDNIRVKKNKIKLQLGASILSIVYLENRVFVSLANGNVHVYDRDISGSWNIEAPSIYTIGSLSTPVSKMAPGSGKLWCVCGNTIKILNTENLIVENSFSVSNDANKLITCIVFSGYGVWISLQNSGIVKCYHTVNFEMLCEINVAPAVTKMLTSCDDIIRQHKAACLRITALVICKDLLWIGTSAGVILIMPLPHILQNSTQLNNVPTVSGLPYGHTGHVRLLTCVEMPVATKTHDSSFRKHQYKVKREKRSTTKLIVISGGDGYEDFRTTNVSEVAGREDSTNHLLLWNI